MVCGAIVNGTRFATWEGAGYGNPDPSILVDQRFEAWDFDATGTFRIIKVLKYKTIDGVTPDWFEVRGKDAYVRDPSKYFAGIDGTEKNCSNVGGNPVYINFDDDDYPTPSGYLKDGHIYKSTLTCDLAVITTQPVGLTKNVGETFVLSVVVAAGGTFTYQWYKGTVAIGGATGSTYTKVNATLADGDSYYCRITNTCGGGKSPSYKNTGTVVVIINEEVETAFTIDFNASTKPVAVKGDCECTDFQFAFSQTESDREDITEGDWNASSEKQFTISGNWYVHIRLQCDHSIGDTRLFYIDSTTQNANPL